MKKIYIEPTCYSHKFVVKTTLLEGSPSVDYTDKPGDNSQDVLGKKGMWDNMSED